MHHFFEVAGRVSAVLTGQTSVLFIDELKLSEKLLHLTLERLGMKKKCYQQTSACVYTSMHRWKIIGLQLQVLESCSLWKNEMYKNQFFYCESVTSRTDGSGLKYRERATRNVHVHSNGLWQLNRYVHMRFSNMTLVSFCLVPLSCRDSPQLLKFSRFLTRRDLTFLSCNLIDYTQKELQDSHVPVCSVHVISAQAAESTF